MVKVMYIESIELSNYRNYSNVKVEFGKNTNILYGDNAQGKTNIHIHGSDYEVTQKKYAG